MEKVSLKEKILSYLHDKDGLTDREITNVVLGAKEPQQAVNQACRALESKGILKRMNRKDGLIGNYLVIEGLLAESSPVKQEEDSSFIFRRTTLNRS